MKTKSFFFVLLSLFIFSSCGKKNDPIPNVPVNLMKLSTENNKGDTIIFKIKANDVSGLWVDLNNNGIKDEGESVSLKDYQKYIVDSKQITVYGKVRAFTIVTNAYITDLDVSKNPDLENLELGHSKFKNLDLSKNLKLSFLRFDRNENLEKLDVTKNTELKLLTFTGTNISELDVSKNKKLFSLICFENKIKELDVSKNPDLSVFRFFLNKIDEDAMKKLVESVPICKDNERGDMWVLRNTSLRQNAHLTKAQVKTLNDRNWDVKDDEGDPYEGI